MYLVNTSGVTGVALDGYDPVSFFADAANPLNGNFEIVSEHKGAKYCFATKDNQKLFEGNPDKYAPQHGGFCSYGASVGALFPVDIKTAQIHNDKLFLNLNTDILGMFNKDIDGAMPLPRLMPTLLIWPKNKEPLLKPKKQQDIAADLHTTNVGKYGRKSILASKSRCSLKSVVTRIVLVS